MTLYEVNIDATLDELAGVMDDALDRKTGMADLLRQWVRAKDIERHLKKGSVWMEAYADKLGPPREPRGVESTSDIVKNYDPAGWEAALYFKVHARLGGPRTRAVPADIERDSRKRTKTATLKRRLAAARSMNRTELKSMRDELVALMDEAEWDESTRVTSDGYRIGRDNQGRFSIARYRELLASSGVVAL